MRTRILAAILCTTLVVTTSVVMLTHRSLDAARHATAPPTSVADSSIALSTQPAAIDELATGDHAAAHLPLSDEALKTRKLVRLTQPHNARFDRFDAISDLGASDDANAELALISLLDDPDPTIRESVVESLAYRASDGAIKALGYALGDSESLVRLAALEYLAEIGTPDAMAMLASVLAESEADVRLAAVYELADIDDVTATGLLQQFLADSSRQVRLAAAEQLSH